MVNHFFLFYRPFPYGVNPFCQFFTFHLFQKKKKKKGLAGFQPSKILQKLPPIISNATNLPLLRIKQLRPLHFPYGPSSPIPSCRRRSISPESCSADSAAQCSSTHHSFAASSAAHSAASSSSVFPVLRLLFVACTFSGDATESFLHPYFWTGGFVFNIPTSF